MPQAFSYQESQQRGAVAALVGRCEKIVGMGCLPESEEARLRELIVETCGVFGMLTQAERPVVQVGDHDPELAWRAA